MCVSSNHLTESSLTPLLPLSPFCFPFFSPFFSPFSSPSRRASRAWISWTWSFHFIITGWKVPINSLILLLLNWLLLMSIDEAIWRPAIFFILPSSSFLQLLCPHLPLNHQNTSSPFLSSPISSAFYPLIIHFYPLFYPIIIPHYHPPLLSLPLSSQACSTLCWVG